VNNQIFFTVITENVIINKSNVNKYLKNDLQLLVNNK
jgi:hypothetical protein